MNMGKQNICVLFILSYSYRLKEPDCALSLPSLGRKCKKSRDSCLSNANRFSENLVINQTMLQSLSLRKNFKACCASTEEGMRQEKASQP